MWEWGRLSKCPEGLPTAAPCALAQALRAAPGGQEGRAGCAALVCDGTVTFLGLQRPHFIRASNHGGGGRAELFVHEGSGSHVHLGAVHTKRTLSPDFTSYGPCVGSEGGTNQRWGEQVNH